MQQRRKWKAIAPPRFCFSKFPRLNGNITTALKNFSKWWPLGKCLNGIPPSSGNAAFAGMLMRVLNRPSGVLTASTRGSITNRPTWMSRGEIWQNTYAASANMSMMRKNPVKSGKIFLTTGCAQFVNHQKIIFQKRMIPALNHSRTMTRG